MGVVLSNNGNGGSQGNSGRESETYGSWPRRPLGSSQLKRVTERALSEPIMSPSNQGTRAEIPLKNGSPGPGPPPPPADYKIPLHQNGRKSTMEKALDIPIIFVLGGPGSGKMTHCNHLSLVVKGLVHLNMMDVFIEMVQEYGSKDINLIPAYKALEALMSNIGGIESATAILVTSYPRNMRDVVEYLAKVQRVDGVILIEWNEKSLEKQVKMGTQNGAIDAELAKAELKNYKANMIPVAEFFDQQGLLHLVAGQRPPNEVFDDLVEEVGGILAYPVGALRQSINNRDDSDKAAVEVHQQRRDSMDSVDAMIEEELKSTEVPPKVNNQRKSEVEINKLPADAAATQSPTQTKPVSIAYTNLTKDVEDILAAVQTSNLLEKAALQRNKMKQQQ